MNIQQKMKGLLLNAIDQYRKNPASGLEQIEQVEDIQASLETTGEGLRNFKSQMVGIKAEIAFDRLQGWGFEFADLVRVHPLKNPLKANKIVIDYMWYGSSPERVQQVTKDMWDFIEDHVQPHAWGDFKIGKPLKVTPLNPNARDQQDAWFRIEVPISL